MIRWLILAIALIALSMAPRGKTSLLNLSGDPAQDVYAAINKDSGESGHGRQKTASP